MTRRGLLLFAAMCVIWGIPYLFIRVAVGELTPATLVFVRTGVAALILMPFVLRRGGLLQMALVVIGYAVAPAILARYLTGIPSVTVIGVALGLCALGYAPAALLQWPQSLPSPGVIGSVAVLAVVCTAIAFLLFFRLIAEIGPVRATVITYVNPAVAAILGVAVLRENLTVGMLFGFVLVLAGSVLATRRRRPAKAFTRAPEAQPADAL